MDKMFRDAGDELAHIEDDIQRGEFQMGEKKQVRYTVTTHHNTFNSGKWYSLHDHKENKDIELDIRNDWNYAVEVCRKFNKEDNAGLHD